MNKLKKPGKTSCKASPGKRGRYGIILLFIFIMGIFVVGTSFYVEQYARVLKINRSIWELEKRLKVLKEKHKRLDIEKSRVYKYDKLYEQSIALGMTYPSKDNVYWIQLSVKDGGTK